MAGQGIFLCPVFYVVYTFWYPYLCERPGRKNLPRPTDRPQVCHTGLWKKSISVYDVNQQILQHRFPIFPETVITQTHKRVLT